MNKHLILIDEQKMILYGLKSFIESSTSCRVLLMASGKEDLLLKLEEVKSNISDSEIENDCFVAIVDIKCGNDSGYEIINVLKEEIPGIKCIFFSMHSTYGNVMYAFEKGIEGFLSKTANEDELILALDAVFQGKTYIQQDLMKDIMLVSNKVSLLTSREKQVFDMICEGVDKKEICSKLKITIRTCENYFSMLYSKMGVSDVKELEEKFGIIKNRNNKTVDSNSSSSEAEFFPKTLKLALDETYDGDGVRILYSGVPKEARILNIVLYDKNKSEQVTFMEDSTYGKNREYYHLGYYIYPFLEAGKRYTFEFVYKKKNDEIVDKATITVVPDRGKEINIKTMDKSNLIIDPENLICSLKENPLQGFPSEASIGINMWDKDWDYLGSMYKKLSDSDFLGPYDFYSDFYFYPKKDKLKSVKKVMFHFFVQYECYEWVFFISSVYPFHPEKL